MDHCRVYWGSHGCNKQRGHDGPHVCACAEEDAGTFDPETREYYDDPGPYNVGVPPYYGSETLFYGEDTTVEERGAPRPLAQFDRFSAVFQPQRYYDLKPGARRLNGQRLDWEAVWVIEPEDSTDYAGHFACALRTDLPEYPGFVWVPDCDLTEFVLAEAVAT